MRLLLIDVDRTFGRVLVPHLTDEGHAVDWIPDEHPLNPSTLGQGHDCLLLGLTTPEDHTPAQRQILRDLLSRVPCLVIAQHMVPGARVAWLDLGADDVLFKPVDLAEMSARIRALTRRGSRSGAVAVADIRCGALTLDPARRIAHWKDRVVALTKKEFWVLEALVRHRHEIVSRSRLEDSLYGWRDEIDSNAVEVYIHKLRRKFDPGLIETFRGLGYRLVTGEYASA
jgi:DNA-binding response OmpR family regulator